MEGQKANRDEAVVIRDGRMEDLAAVAEIDTFYARHTVHTFDTEPLPVEGWVERFRTDVVGGVHAFVVAERQQGLVGYVRSGSFRPKPA